MIFIGFYLYFNAPHCYVGVKHMDYQSLSYRSTASAVVLIIFIIISGLLVGCSLPTSTPPRATQTPTKLHLKFAIVTNSPASDPFWSVVKRGVDRAAKDMGVTVTYRAPDTFSISAMSQLIDDAVASKPDGLVVSIPDCTGLTPAIKRAQLVGIPVISINSGSNCASKLGLLNHVGEAGYQAGLEAGQKFAAAGARRVLCINKGVGDPDLDDRCRGINDAMTQAGGRSKVLPIDLNNPTLAQQKIQANLTKDPSINAVMALSPISASLAIAAIQRVGRSSQIMLATFDLSSAVFQDIEQGTMLFAIDQQPYLQGYLPIVLLNLYKTNLNTAENPVIMTGPNFVTKDNVAQVQQLTEAGTGL